VFTTTIADMMKLKKRPLITIKEEETIEQAIHLFRETKLSKLVVVTEEGKLHGVLSYYDLISFLMSPKKERGPQGVDKSALHTKKVKHFAKSYVLTLSPDDYARDALHLILEKKIGSIVVVDSHNKPLDIITTRDMLTLLIREPNIAKVEISTKNLSLKSNIVTKNFFERLKDSLTKKNEMAKAKLFVKEEKQGGLFRVVLSLFPKRGKPKIVAREGKDLENVLQQVKKEE
jgi:CBS domain-containing protein